MPSSPPNAQERACYCDSRQCEICTPEMRGDLANAVTTLAADNARLCGIALAADKLATAASAHVVLNTTFTTKQLESAVHDYAIVRRGS